MSTTASRPPQHRYSLRSRFLGVLLFSLIGLLTIHMVAMYVFVNQAVAFWADDLLSNLAEDAQHYVAAQHDGTHTPKQFWTARRFQVQIWYLAPNDRALVARSTTASDTALDPMAMSKPGGKPITSVWHRNGRWWRVRTEFRPAGEGRWWVVQTAVDMTEWFDRRVWIGGVFFAAALVVLGLFAFLMERLTRWMLWPMEQVSQLAQDIIATQDLSRRLPTKLPVPEIQIWAQAFNAALDRLEDLFWQQRRFLADVSHELRTPLTIIRGQAQLMQRTGQFDAEAVADIEKEAERLSRLVEDLLFLARAEAGALPLHYEDVDLDALLLEVLRQGQRLAAGKQQNLVLEHLEPLPVRGDPDRLTQAILNLLSNAVQYTPAGGTIRVGLRREGDHAALWVSDTGPGIPPEDLPHVFERFYRADRSRTRRGSSGFGLGLSIVRWIIEAHGGHVAVASKVGQGTTFTLYIPLDQERWLEEEEASED